MNKISIGVKPSASTQSLSSFLRITLLIATGLMLFAMLGAREIWTQEHRWADIVSGMFYRHDFLHPYLGANDYYDKPLLSYWMIAIFAKLTGSLSLWVLRLPSACAGLLAVWSIYRLGTQLRDQAFGILCGWLLLTTFFFIFWARTSSADMLNLAGALFAVSWYFDKKHQATFFDLSIFFCILAVTALCKGLVGPVVAVLAILPNLILEKSFKRFLQLKTLAAMLPAILIYISPFLASAYFSNNQYGENGLYLVYRENILRYFQPFDHKDPFYTYFIYLPLYLLPWSVFFIPALFSLKSHWKNLSIQSRWMAWSLFILFVFFTLSGSRRSYYVLPMLPFAILLTADWLRRTNPYWLLLSKKMIVCFYSLFFIFMIILQPLYYYGGGQRAFSTELKKELIDTHAWQFALLDAESKVRYYLQLPPNTKSNDIQGNLRHLQTQSSLLQKWPVLTEHNPHLVLITRQRYKNLLIPLLKNYKLIETPSSPLEKLFNVTNPNSSIAFIPNYSRGAYLTPLKAHNTKI